MKCGMVLAGGGGGGTDPEGSVAGDGGSGIIIVRYSTVVEGPVP